jgi:catechol 2,3-dioxygenase-like lactoylglutathione lyase family enzyme
MLQVRSLDHFVLRVRNLESSLAFYRDVLGLKIEFLEEYRAGTRPFVSARVGETSLIDLVPDATYDPEKGANAGGFLHFCLDVPTCDFERVIPWLRGKGVDVIEEQPVPRMGARGMGLSIYVRDPDGYVVELKREAN